MDWMQSSTQSIIEIQTVLQAAQPSTGDADTVNSIGSHTSMAISGT
jgi:hypothetical protein